jgi:hypothetical protein
MNDAYDNLLTIEAVALEYVRSNTTARTHALDKT